MHSTFSQLSACCRISVPRAPGPMMPRRIRWLAPRALPAASVPARPVATLPMKLRRDCMGIGSLDVNPIIYGRGGGADGCEGRRRTGSGWKESSGFILFGLGEKMGSFGVFVFGDWLGVSGDTAGGCSSALRYSTGRGWSLKSELGEVMGGEGVRFLGVGGNGRTKFDAEARRESELRSDAQGGALC